MNIHENARLTPQGRTLMVSRILKEGWRVADAAGSAGVSERTAFKWLGRYRAGGAAALNDRKPTPATRPHATPAETVVRIEGLRRERLSDCLAGQALCHGFWSRSMALRMVRSLRMAATRAALADRPRLRSRSYSSPMTGFQRMAVSAAMYRTLRTADRPPAIARWPRMVPESRLIGATPTKAAMLRRSIWPSRG